MSLWFEPHGGKAGLLAFKSSVGVINSAADWLIYELSAAGAHTAPRFHVQCPVHSLSHPFCVCCRSAKAERDANSTSVNILTHHGGLPPGMCRSLLECTCMYADECMLEYACIQCSSCRRRMVIDSLAAPTYVTLASWRWAIGSAGPCLWGGFRARVGSTLRLGLTLRVTISVKVRDRLGLTHTLT